MFHDFHDVCPEDVRKLCARRSWDDDADDESRIVLELAADTIRELMCRTGMQAKRLEIAEYELALMRRVCYGPQKGGAA